MAGISPINGTRASQLWVLTGDWAPDILDGSECTYCGGVASVWDHVIPVQLLKLRDPREHTSRFQRGDWIVKACTSCNFFLSSRILLNVPLRARWLEKRYRKKFARILHSASWTETELSQIRGGFRSYVRESMAAQRELDLRLTHLAAVGAQSEDYLRPYPVGA